MTSLIVLVVSVVFTMLVGYYGFLRRRTKRVAWPRAVFVAGLALSLVAGYAVWKETRALTEVSTLIQPFPGIQRAVWVPAMPSAERTWTFRAAGTPETIYRFYADEAHRRGWAVVVNSNIYLVMKKNDSVLSISFLYDRAAGDSVLVYSLEPARQ